MKKGLALWVSLLLIFTIVLSGCGNSSSTSGKASGDNGSNGKKTVLKVELWDENAKEAVSKSVKDFEDKHPNVDVQVTYTPWNDYWTKLKTSLAGGSGPDVFWMNGTYLPDYISSGMVKDLQPIVDKEKFDTSVFWPSLVNQYTWKNDLYGMPYFLDSIALFYNKKLFDEAHVPYPNDNWTLDDVEKAGLKLTDKSKGQYGYIAQTAEAQKQYFNTIFEEGGNLINKEGTKSEFDSPETRSAFEWMQKLINEGVSPTGKQQAETAPDQLFASGKAAMIQMISVNAASMYKSLGKNLGIAMLPKGKQRGVVVSGIGWAMNNHTQHQDLAWELMKSLTDKQSGQYVAESGFSIPAYKGSEQEWVKSIPDVNLQAFIEDLKYGVPIPNTENAMEWWSVMGTEVQKMFFGEESIDQATKNVADKMNQVIAASNK